MEYAEKIRILRKVAGLTQQELGELCGYEGNSAGRTVQHWEYGRSYPPAEKLRILAKVLNTTLDQIVP